MEQRKTLGSAVAESVARRRMVRYMLFVFVVGAVSFRFIIPVLANSLLHLPVR